jgi:hypothetical protein
MKSEKQHNDEMQNVGTNDNNKTISSSVRKRVVNTRQAARVVCCLRCCYAFPHVVVDLHICVFYHPEEFFENVIWSLFGAYL